MAQDTTPAIIVYQGDGSNSVFDVPFDKGYYGDIKVLFVRRGLADYTYLPNTFTVSGRLYAWQNGGAKIYTHTPNPAIGAPTYNSSDVEQAETVSAIAGQTITVDSLVYSRAVQHDISSNMKLTWTGDMLEVGDFICIVRDTERGQPYEMPNNQKHIERALDNIERQVQEVKDATDNALKIDPSHDIPDSHKMNPIDWLNSIIRCMDFSVRALRYANGWLNYSLDDPNIDDTDKTWTHLLNTDNVRSIRERSTIVDGVTLYYTEYLSEDGVWRAFADSPASVNTKVDKAGDTMTGVLKMRASESFKCAIAPSWDGVGFFKLNDNDSVTLMASMEEIDGLTPATNNKYNIGKSAYRWKDLYLSGKAYMSVINNGYDLLVPAKSGTLATKEEVDLAANSGSQLYDTGVWYAKMHSETVVPTGAEYNGRKYADFSQTDSGGNPIIVIYEGQSGAWAELTTITPPAEYNGYITVTSKIWDIAEQAGQQGGEVLWDYTHKTFTPYPKIVSFENAALTGVSTAPTPTDSSPTNQIVNKDYVDTAITNSGTGRNVGDIFFTMRNDNELNGAVECDGTQYNTTDFTGAQSIGQLLSAGKVPYVSLSAYADEITAKGWCDKFGWDGAGTTAFKVPTLNAYIWQKLNTPVVGTGKGLGIVGGQTGTWTARFNGQGNNGSEYVIVNTFNVNPGTGGSGDYIGGGAIGVATDPTKSALTTDTTGNISDQRVMVQLAVSATDEALETCTAVTAQVAANTAAIAGADYVVESQLPTAANNYTWYRKYRDGWVEQGGIHVLIANNSNYSQSLPIAMADTHYTVTIAQCASNDADYEAFYYNQGCVLARTTTTVTLSNRRIAGSGTRYIDIMWQVSGMAA